MPRDTDDHFDLCLTHEDRRNLYEVFFAYQAIIAHKEEMLRGIRESLAQAMNGQHGPGSEQAVALLQRQIKDLEGSISADKQLKRNVIKDVHLRATWQVLAFRVPQIDKE